MPLLRRLWTFGAIVVVGLLAGACVGLPTESTWGDISLIGNPPSILFAFSDRIVKIDPTDGSAVDLLDPEGKVRVDADGNPRPWMVQGSGNPALHFYTRPMQINDTTLLTAAYEQKLYEIDVARAEIDNPNGIDLPGHVVANPVLTDNFLYVPLSEGGVIALDPTDYSEKWRFLPDTAKGVYSSPLLIEGTLYVSEMNHHLYALDAQTGAVKWDDDLEGAVASTPTYANNALYVGSFASKLFKVNLDGTIAAEYTTTQWIWGAPAVVDNMVYATDLGGSVYALRDAGSSFEEVWSRKVAEGAIRMTPLVTADTIILGSRDHNLYWLSLATGEELIKREMRGEVLSDILLIEPNDTVREPLIIVSTLANEERLVAFSLDRGERRWVYGV